MEKDHLFRLAEHYIENTNVSLFLTGKAGTGKTTFLRHITDTTTKRYVVLAPTGVAAVNAHGTTIHSFFSLPLCPYLPDVPELKTEYQMPEQCRRLRKDKIKIIRTLDLLIIDEISMVRADLLDAVDMTLRRHRHNQKPFGGVQILMIGDAQQLSPVVTEKERPFIERVYPSPYFFSSKALQGDERRMAERIARACDYFLPILEGLELKELMKVDVDNTEVRTRLRRLAEELIPLWQAHLDTLSGVRSDGFDASRFRQLRTQALLGESATARKARKAKQAAEVPAEKTAGALADRDIEDMPASEPERDLYNDNRHPELVAALKEWRRDVAHSEGVPAYHILRQKTLLGIADANPSTREEMLEVYGFGPRLWEKYGEQILDVLGKAAA